MRSVSKLLLAGLAVVVLVAACSPAATPTPTPQPKPKIALVPAGRIETQGFMNMAGEGYLLAAEAFDFEPAIWESEVPEEWERNVRTAAQEGYDLIIGVGSTMQDAVAHVAPEFPDQHFALLDAYVGGDNAAGLISDDHEGSFLAGALAAMMTSETSLEGLNPAKVVGFLGGMDIPVVHNFHGGFKQGAEYIDPEIEIKLAYVGSFRDPTKAKELALAMFQDQDVDIIYSVTGSFGDVGVFEAAQETGKYVLCQDLNREEEAPGTVMMCNLRSTDKVVYDYIKDYLDGKFQSGEIHYGVGGGYVGTSPMAVMGDSFPTYVMEKLEEIKKDIGNGTITVERTN